jgi:hypothetical protein
VRVAATVDVIERQKLLDANITTSGALTFTTVGFYEFRPDVFSFCGLSAA